MRKLVLLLALMFSVSLIAQDLVDKEGRYWQTYTGVAGDTLSADSSLIKTVSVARDGSYDYKFWIQLDSAGNADDVTVSIIAKPYQVAEDTALLGTVTYGVTADTTFVISGTSDYKWIEIWFNGASSSADMLIDKIYWGIK